MSPRRSLMKLRNSLFLSTNTMVYCCVTSPVFFGLTISAVSSSLVLASKLTSPWSFSCSRSLATAMAFDSGLSRYICISDIRVMICSICEWSELTCSFISTLLAFSAMLPMIDAIRAIGWRSSSLAVFTSLRCRVSSPNTAFFFCQI